MGSLNILWPPLTNQRDIDVLADDFAAPKLLIASMVSEGVNTPTFSYADVFIGALKIVVAMATGLVLANTIVYWYMSHP